MKQFEDKIRAMSEAGRILGSTLFDLRKATVPDVRPIDLDQMAARLIRERGGEPAFAGYQGFPANICISVNDAVVHGIPGPIPLAAGDIVTYDVGVLVRGYYADAAITIGVGEIEPEIQELLRTTAKALDAGISKIFPGRRLGDVQAAIQAVLEEKQLGIIQELTGHGIGRTLHEPPNIANYGRAGTGIKLTKGMTICLEPMATLGEPAIAYDGDGWTIRTQDGSMSAQFEHTILVKLDGAEILTSIRPWSKNWSSS